MKCILFCILILAIFLPVHSKDIYKASYPTIPGTPITQSFGHKGHVGVDFTLYVGSPVYAVLTGKVIYVGLERVYGNCIMIQHLDGYASLYGHLSKINVKEGNWVHSGTLIGLSGGDKNKDPEGSGWSSGPHLHFEIRVPDHLHNNLYNIDPMKYLGFNDEE